MDSATLEKLTGKQRECLRLAYLHMESKDIARALGISPTTADMHLKAAARRLGVQRRKEAIRIYAAAVAQGISQPLACHSPDLSGDPEYLSWIDPNRGFEADRSGKPLREDLTPFFASDFLAAPAMNATPLPTGDLGHDLTIKRKLSLIVASAVVAALAFGAIISGLEALTRLS